MDASYYSRVGPRPMVLDAEPVAKKRKIVPEPKLEIPKLSTPHEIKAAVLASNATSALTAQSLNQDVVKQDTSTAQNITAAQSVMQPTKGSEESHGRVPAMASSEFAQNPESMQTKINNQLPTLQSSVASGSSTATRLPGAVPNHPRPPLKKRVKQPTSIFLPNKRPRPQ